MSDEPNATAASKDFEFEALRQAYHYPRAIVREFAPHLRGHIIEVGAGIGQLTQLFAEHSGAGNITAIEPEAHFARIFRKESPEIHLVEGTVQDLPIGTECDVIVSVNVMEHIPDDGEEMRRYHSLLRARRGTFCILTPARPEIYAPIDRDFGHFRRYTRPSLSRVLRAAGFDIERIYYFNLPGYFLWALNFKLLGSRSFNPLMVRLYDRTIFRATNLIERFVAAPPVGQSLIAIARAR